MEYVFGDVFICKNIDIAKRVTFDQRILKRCVTLDGDSTDPRGKFLLVYFFYYL